MGKADPPDMHTESSVLAGAFEADIDTITNADPLGVQGITVKTSLQQFEII